MGFHTCRSVVQTHKNLLPLIPGTEVVCANRLLGFLEQDTRARGRRNDQVSFWAVEVFCNKPELLFLSKMMVAVLSGV